jgi:hypothetical protein
MTQGGTKCFMLKLNGGCLVGQESNSSTGNTVFARV